MLGTFYVNINSNDAVTKNLVTAFTLHEALPGHHMQHVVTSKSNLPNFLRYPYGGQVKPSAFQTYEAYREGWGLYSEYLGHDMGVYRGHPRKELGQISGALLRAARVIVDPGNFT